MQFLKFGDYSLDFRLLVWTNQPRRHVQIRSDINYRIAELFRERSIRIPYPTQEFLLKGMPRNLEPSLLPTTTTVSVQPQMNADRTRIGNTFVCCPLSRIHCVTKLSEASFISEDAFSSFTKQCPRRRRR